MSVYSTLALIGSDGRFSQISSLLYYPGFRCLFSLHVILEMSKRKYTSGSKQQLIDRTASIGLLYLSFVLFKIICPPSRAATTKRKYTGSMSNKLGSDSDSVSYCHVLIGCRFTIVRLLLLGTFNQRFAFLSSFLNENKNLEPGYCYTKARLVGRFIIAFIITMQNYNEL